MESVSIDNLANANKNYFRMFINIYSVNGAHSTGWVETYTFVYYTEAVNELISVKLVRMCHVQSCIFFWKYEFDKCQENMDLINVS